MLAEAILVCAFLISTAMRMFGFPGANLLLVVSLQTLAIYYPVKYVIYSRRHGNFHFVLYGLALATAGIGCLFKLMYWPNGDVLAMAGSILAVAVLGLIFIRRESFGTVGGGFSKLGLRLAVAGLICGSLWAIPTEALVDFQYRDNPEYGKLILKYKQDPSEENRKALNEYSKKTTPE